MNDFIEERTRYYMSEGKMSETAARALAKNEARAPSEGEEAKPKRKSRIQELIENGKQIAEPPSGAVAVRDRKHNAPVVEQLPLFGARKKPIPNHILRTSVFLPTARKISETENIKEARANFLSRQPGKRIPIGRERVEGFDLKGWGKTQLIYTGYRVDQLDLDVWEMLLEMIKETEAAGGSGTTCVFEMKNLLKRLGLTDTGKNRAAVAERIYALSFAKVTIYERYSYEAHLIQEIFTKPSERKYAGTTYAEDEIIGVSISPRLLSLFGDGMWTALDWEIRKELKKGLSKWLHGFYSTHSSGMEPPRLETIAASAGIDVSTSLAKRHFRADLKVAFAEIAAAGKKAGMTFKGWLDTNDRLHVKKSDSLSQRKNVAKKLQAGGPKPRLGKAPEQPDLI